MGEGQPHLLGFALESPVEATRPSFNAAAIRTDSAFRRQVASGSPPHFTNKCKKIADAVLRTSDLHRRH
jgi:hypothetical protein